MKFALQDVKPDKTNPTTAFTATLYTDDKPLANVTMAVGMDWPDMTYHKNRADAEKAFAEADAAAQTLGSAHLYDFVLKLYAGQQKEISEAQEKAAKDMHIRKLCLTALVIKLPRHAEGEYWLATEAPKQLISSSGKKGSTTVTGTVGSQAHKDYILAMLAEAGTDITQVSFYNDRFETAQGTLKLAA